MKPDFIEDTKNIIALKQAMGALRERDAKIPGLGLICGKAGLGKTEAMKWYSSQNALPYLRAMAAWSLRYMLKEISYELGLETEGGIPALIGQIKDELLAHPRLIIIDEADYLARAGKWHLLETLRDIHDLTSSPFVFIGEGNIKAKLAKKSRIGRRVSQVVEFQPLTIDEIALVTQDLTGLEIKDGVPERLMDITDGFFGFLMVALSKLERVARANSRNHIDRKMVGIIQNEVLKRKAA